LSVAKIHFEGETPNVEVKFLFDDSYSFFLPLSERSAYIRRWAFAIWVMYSLSKYERDET